MLLLLSRPCFCVSLLYIGVMVVIITDLASIFGCLVGLKEESSITDPRQRIRTSHTLIVLYIHS